MRRLALLLVVIMLWPSGARAAANFHLFDQQGHMLSLEDFAGHPMALLFWATWCRDGERSLLAFHRSQRPGIVFLAVDESVGEEDPDLVRAHVQSLHLRIPVLFDDLGEAADALKVTSLPTLVLLDRRHAVVLRRAGPFAPEALEAAWRLQGR